jgi:hypothetical protein
MSTTIFHMQSKKPRTFQDVKGFVMQQESSAIPFSPVRDAPAICAEEWL